MIDANDLQTRPSTPTFEIHTKGLAALLFAILAVVTIQFGYTVYRNINISHCVISHTDYQGQIGVGSSTYCLAH